MLKRFSFVLVLVLALTMVFAASAFANFGPHGGYANDTDSCAGCHRAHTSFSTVGWTDKGGNPHASALLVGNATTMTEFCDACHGDTAPGASTNVASGVFDSGPSAAGHKIVGGVLSSGDTSGSASSTTGNKTQTALVANAAHSNGVADGSDGAVSVTTAYQTDSTFNAPLNGGGFNRMPDPYAWQSNTSVAYVAASSSHKMDVSGPLWGAGTSVADFAGGVDLTCTDCHDPHGSSNYRLLKAVPNPGGPSVGGYTGVNNDIPNAFVFSNEQGYPVPNGKDAFGGLADPNNVVGGWLKHGAGAAQMALYRPNYTDTTGTPILHVDGAAAGSPASKSMSVWCAACHTDYNQASAGTAITYDYGTYLGVTPTKQNFHRHPIDQTMAAGAPGNSNASLTEPIKADADSSKWVPLEQATSGDGSLYNNYIGCLTCHRAHGSSVVMSGWSNASLVAVPSSVNATSVYVPVRDATWGVTPDKQVTGAANGTSALLRADNRGVCERCHNK